MARPTQRDWKRFAEGLKDRLHGIALQALEEAKRREAQKALPVEEDDPVRVFGEMFQSELAKGFANAWRMGRMLNGYEEPLNEGERLKGLAYADAEAEFIHELMLDIMGGKYNGPHGESSLKARCTLYARKTRGVANEAFVETGPDGAEYDWVMLAMEHCVDCPDMAELSPWTRNTLWTYPGMGDTECMTNCKCVLQRDDGQGGFGREDA